MLIGEYRHNLDNKNRLMMPAKTLSSLGEEVIVSRGFEKCLLVYPVEKWNNVIEKFSELSITKSDTRKFMRILLSGATSCKFDAHARICIPSVLKSYANLDKECVIVGLMDHLEIWSESDYQKFLDENLEDFAAIAEDLYE
jgi:MraZ protein